jgi:hypothetical protein
VTTHLNSLAIRPRTGHFPPGRVKRDVIQLAQHLNVHPNGRLHGQESVQDLSDRRGTRYGLSGFTDKNRFRFIECRQGIQIAGIQGFLEVLIQFFRTLFGHAHPPFKGMFEQSKMGRHDISSPSSERGVKGFSFQEKNSKI